MAALNEWSAQDLAALPTRNGFHQRGMDMTRLETFTDAAFAFAVTLLVVGGGDSIPGNSAEFIEAMKRIPAFAASFAQIMLFWYAHHIWSRRFGLDDLGSVYLSLLLVFVILIFIYPLNVIYSIAISHFSGDFFLFNFDFYSYSDIRSAFAVFGLGYAAMSGAIILLNRHALAKKDSLGLNELEIYDTRTDIKQWMIGLVVAVISIVLALSMPDDKIYFSGMLYGVFGIVLPWNGIRRGRQRDKLFSASATEQVS